MITKIHLQNFKCFRTVDIRPKQITAFVGANGTGKSSVLQAFGLLKQTFAANLDSFGNGQPWQLVTRGPLVSLPNKFSIMFGFDGSKVSFTDISISGLVKYWPESPMDTFHFTYSAELLMDDFGGQTGSQSKDGSYPTDFQAMGKTLERLALVPALRGFSHPTYPLGDDIAPSIAMEDGYSQQEPQAATNLAYSKNSTEKTSAYLKRISGVGLRIDPVPSKLVQVNSTTVTGPVNITLEGYGTNSLTWLLHELFSAPRDATVMIEEPEIHLHPRAQAELAEVLAEVALKEDKQVIMTTHSEHITGRLLTLVAEGKLTPDDVAIYAFEKDEQGVCTAKDLRINPEGTIEGGINDFFETNLEEMNRFAQAQFKRAKPNE